MRDLALRTLEICAGVGMLGEGLRAGLAHLGLTTRTVAYLEREAYPAATIAARCEEGSLDPAPVWSDLLTFDARRWRGAVDLIAAGFPCQDLSLAGRRAGLDGKRSGLFFDILDIADGCGASKLFLENVGGIASATATVVDEAEGELEERAAARVLGELADRGWDAEWITVSASDVGASHGRARWFCLAWRRLGHAGSIHDEARRPISSPGGQPEGRQRPYDAVVALDDAERCCMHGESVHARSWPGGARAPDPIWASEPVGDAHVERHHRAQPHTEPAGSAELAHAGGCVADAAQHGRIEGRAQPGGQQGRPDAAEHGGSVADAQRGADERRGEPAVVAGEGGSAGSEAPQHERRGHAADDRGEAVAHANGPGQRSGWRASLHSEWQPPADDDERGEGLANASEPGPQGPGSPVAQWRGEPQPRGADGRLLPLFAPGPADPRWPGILAAHPHLAPALEPSFRGVVDGVAFAMDECRAPRLKCVGNGVVAAQAGFAFVVLARRAGWGVGG